MSKREATEQEHKLIKRNVCLGECLAFICVLFMFLACGYAIFMENYVIYSQHKGILFAIASYFVQTLIVGLMVLLVIAIKESVRNVKKTWKKMYKVEDCTVVAKKNIGSYKRVRVKITVEKEGGNKSTIILPAANTQMFKIGTRALLITYEKDKNAKKKDEVKRDLVNVNSLYKDK